MSEDKKQLIRDRDHSKHHTSRRFGMPEKDFKVATICGSALAVFGIFMGWAVFQSTHLSIIWPGLVLGFCFSLIVPYLVIKASKQKTVKNKKEESEWSNLGGLGAGLGVLFFGVFHEQETFMANLAAVAASLLFSMGFFFIVLAMWKKGRLQDF